MKKKEELYQLVVGTAEVCGHEMTVPAAKMIARDLASYPIELGDKALEKCRRQVSGRLTLALIVQRIDDGHLGVEEAWALCPRSEDETVIWTDEISEAFGVARLMLEDDAVAARMAFKEAYARLLSEAREARRMATWKVSLGARSTRCPALKHAVELGLLPAADALRLVDETLPGHSALSATCGKPVKALPREQAPEPPDDDPVPPSFILADILKKLKGGV